MTLLESTRCETTKNKNIENVPSLEMTKNY